MKLSNGPSLHVSSSQSFVESLQLTEYEKYFIRKGQIPPCRFYYSGEQYNKHNTHHPLRNNKVMMTDIINKVCPKVIIDLGSSTGGDMIHIINKSSSQPIHLYACDYDTATGIIYQQNIDNWYLYPNNGTSCIADFHYIDGWVDDIEFNYEHKGSRLWILKGGTIGNFDLQGRRDTINKIVSRLDKGDSSSIDYFVAYNSQDFDYSQQTWRLKTISAYPIKYYESVLRQKGFGCHHTKPIHRYYDEECKDIVVVFEVDNYESKHGLVDENYTKSVRGQVAQLLGDSRHLTMRSHRFTDDEIVGLVDDDSCDVQIVSGSNPFMKTLLITKK